MLPPVRPQAGGRCLWLQFKTACTRISGVCHVRLVHDSMLFYPPPLLPAPAGLRPRPRLFFTAAAAASAGGVSAGGWTGASATAVLRAPAVLTSARALPTPRPLLLLLPLEVPASRVLPAAASCAAHGPLRLTRDTSMRCCRQSKAQGGGCWRWGMHWQRWREGTAAGSKISAGCSGGQPAALFFASNSLCAQLVYLQSCQAARLLSPVRLLRGSVAACHGRLGCLHTQFGSFNAPPGSNVMKWGSC